MENLKKEIGERLRHARDRADIRQNRAATHIGVHNSTLNKYESGDREADHETMVKLADLYGVNLHWLLTGDGQITYDERTQVGKTRDSSSQKEQSADDETGVGRAFFGGSDQYTEEELEIARAAAQAAIEAYRKGQKKQKDK